MTVKTINKILADRDTASLTIWSPVFAFEDTMDTMGRLELLSESGNIVVSENRRIQSIYALPRR
jgi:hypothetical protein